jgi:hypothetical protein
VNGGEQQGAAARAQTAQRPSLSSVSDEVRAALSARAHLFELEARRAVWSAAVMVGLAVAAALLAVTVWLIVVGALMALAIRLGVPWGLTVIIAVALQAGAAWLLVGRARGLIDNLTFAATRRTLTRRTVGSSDGGRL